LVDDQTLVMDLTNKQTYEFNSTASAIWHMIFLQNQKHEQGGGWTKEVVLTPLLQVSNADPRHVGRQVDEFLAECVARGFLLQEGREA
jgi:hypothetical protein